MKDADLVRLMLLQESLEDAEHLSSVLRNAGIAVRPSGAEDLEDLAEALRDRPIDLILMDAELPGLDVKSVVDTVMRSGKEIPVIVTQAELNVDRHSELLNDGVTAVVFAEVDQHVVHTVRREMHNLTSRRDLRRIEAALRESEKRCYSLLDSSRDPIAYIHDGMHVYANAAYLALFGEEEFEELEGMPILDMIATEHQGQVKDLIRSLSKGQKPPDQLVIKINRPDGSQEERHLSFAPASIEGEPCTQFVFREPPTAQSIDAKELRDLKTRDLVTGLHNRQHMLQELIDAHDENSDETIRVALLMIDIDNFREVLDQVGITGVDLVLGDVAKVLTKNVEDTDSLGRFADHSFAILCRDCDLEQAKQRAEKIRSAIEAYICDVDGKSLPVTASVGVAVVTEAVRNPQDTFSLAAAAARKARESGGNKLEVHDPVKQVGQSENDLNWIAVVKDALVNDRFFLVYQPVISLHGESGHHYEVLLRLRGPKGATILPSQFLPVVADHELMLKVDRWVVHYALKKLRQHQDENPDDELIFFIKITGQSAIDPRFIPWVSKQLQNARVSGSKLIFEFPEDKAFTNLKPAKRFLNGLRELNARMCVEKFGANNNSFQLLKHLPCDFIKIDRSFMADLSRHPSNQERIKEICDQARSKSKLTVAEFVEDAASMSILWQCGVNFVQGNFLQEPLDSLAYEFSE